MEDRNRRTNSTDYDLPALWGRMDQKQKSDWYTLWRVRRQATRQDTTVGRELARQKEQLEQSYKIEEDLE